MLAASLAFSSTLTAFATGEDEGGGTTPATTGTLTVTGANLKDKTVTAIRMFSMTASDTNNDGKIGADEPVSYTLESAWEGFFVDNADATQEQLAGKINVTTQEGATLSEKAYNYVAALTNGETDTANGTKDASLVQFAKAAEAWATATANASNLSGLTLTATGQAVENSDNDTATFSNVAPGYYLVYPASGSTSTARQTDAMLVNVLANETSNHRRDPQAMPVE